MLLASSVVACQSALCLGREEKKLRKSYLKTVKDGRNKPIKTVTKLSKASNIDALLQTMWQSQTTQENKHVLADMFIDAYQKRLGREWKKAKTTVRAKANEYFNQVFKSAQASGSWSHSLNKIDAIKDFKQLMEIENKLHDDIEVLYGQMNSESHTNVVNVARKIAEYKILKKHVNRLGLKKGLLRTANALGVDNETINALGSTIAGAGKALHDTTTAALKGGAQALHNTVQKGGQAVKDTAKFGGQVVGGIVKEGAQALSQGSKGLNQWIQGGLKR